MQRQPEDHRDVLDGVDGATVHGCTPVCWRAAAAGGRAAVSDSHAVVTPTGVSFRRWEMPVDDLLVVSIDGGSIVERGSRPGGASTPMFLTLVDA